MVIYIQCSSFSSPEVKLFFSSGKSTLVTMPALLMDTTAYIGLLKIYLELEKLALI